MNVSSTKELIKTLTSVAGISRAELSRRLCVSPQVIDNRAKIGKFSLEEWNNICEVCGFRFEIRAINDEKDLSVVLTK